MQANNDFPGLEGQGEVKPQTTPENWENEIARQEPKPEEKKPEKKKKKMMLKKPAADAPVFNPEAVVDFKPEEASNVALDFFGTAQQPQQQTSTNDFFFMQNNNNSEPFYTFPAKDLGYGELVIQDQFGNLFELEQGQYLDNGQIFDNFYENNEQDDYFNNYGAKKTQTQQTQKKDTKKKETKKAPKTPAPPPKPKVFKRLQKLEGQTEEEKAKAQMGSVIKQERMTIKQLVEKEKDVIKGDSKYIKCDNVKQQINLVFIGHVDAGKSTLSGRVLVNTGEVDEKMLQQLQQEASKNKKEGWFLAYCMDLSEDERAKGKTVETGKAFFELSNRRFTLLDAPGHKNYVPNMITGACQSDMACLIISSKIGEFEAGFEKGGQTTEHVQLIRALGVQNLVCIISKMDTNNWSQERYNEIVDKIQPWIKKTCDFEKVTFIPIDALNGSSGQNVSGRVDPGVCQWYDGPSMFEYLNESPVPKREPEAGLKFPVLDIQKEEGKLYAYGKIECGNIFEGMHVTSMPNRKTFQIQEIFDAKDRKMYYASAGENVKVKVAGKGLDSEEDLQRGFMICSTDELCGVSGEFLAEIQVLEMPEGKPLMSSGYQAIMHMHTTVQEVEIEEIQAVYDRQLGKFIKHNILKNGDKGIVKINSDKFVCLEKFDNFPCLGRFTIRAENNTIAYGTVKKFKPAFEFQRLLAKQNK